MKRESRLCDVGEADSSLFRVVNPVAARVRGESEEGGGGEGGEGLRRLRTSGLTKFLSFLFFLFSTPRLSPQPRSFYFQFFFSFFFYKYHHGDRYFDSSMHRPFGHSLR